MARHYVSFIDAAIAIAAATRCFSLTLSSLILRRAFDIFRYYAVSLLRVFDTRFRYATSLRYCLHYFAICCLLLAAMLLAAMIFHYCRHFLLYFFDISPPPLFLSTMLIRCRAAIDTPWLMSA